MGRGFGSLPAPTNVAYPGYTGDDYGNALYACDTSNNPNAFCAGQKIGNSSGDTIGLVVQTYTDTEISYTLGSTYAQSYYPSNISALQQGDTFAVYVKGAICSGHVSFGATIQCQGSSAPAAVGSVTFAGSPADPQVTLSGQRFGSEPTATNQAYPGYTGYDYGNAMYFCDTSNDPNSFCAGQNDGSCGPASGRPPGSCWDLIGLVVSTYTDTQISSSLGSTYGQYYYPQNIYQLEPGDTFAVYVKGSVCTGQVDYSGQPVPCQGSVRATPPSTIVNKVLPSIVGEPIQGRTMRVTHGTWTGTPTTFNYQWQRCDALGAHCFTLAGAIGTAYQPAAGDVGHTIRVEEIAAIGAHAFSVPTAPVLPALQYGPKVRRKVINAASTLLKRRTAKVRLFVTMTGPVAKSLAVPPGATLTGTGIVDFTNHQAEWQLSLPKSLGGGMLRVRTVGSATYAQLGVLTSSAHGGWVSVSSSALRELPRLGLAGSLAVLLNPDGTTRLLRSITAGVVKVTSTTSGGGSVGGEPHCSQMPVTDQVEAGLALNRLSGLSKTASASYGEALSSLASPRMVAQFGASGTLTGIQLLGHNGLTITTAYCDASRVAKVTAPPAPRVTKIHKLTLIDPCLVGRWRLAGPAGAAELTISPTGSATLVYQVQRRIAGDYGLHLPDFRGGQNAIGVFGSANVTVLASRLNSPQGHQLVWATNADNVKQIIAGNYFPGGHGLLPTVVQPHRISVGVNGIVQSPYKCTRTGAQGGDRTAPPGAAPAGGGELTLRVPIGTKPELGFTPLSWHRG